MPRLRAAAAAAGLAALLGCAQIGEPPGGPPDSAPPALVGTHPDSTAVLPGFDQDAAFLFDEVVNEGTSPNFGLGTGDLERLVILSPSEEVPVVRWRRSRITVRPREGWQPDRVYRIELLPGVTDLRTNRSTRGQVITFTTGAPLPTRVLTGRVVDWTTARPVRLALVEAILQPDSLVYRTSSDSSGRFTFGPLPDGEYLVSGAIDQNRNRRRDARELFDTLRLAAGRDSAGELWVFRHDSIGPRIQALAQEDSVAIGVTFNQHLNPYQRLPADSVRVRALPDSTDLPVVAILPKAAYDSVYNPRPAAARDTAAADSLPRPDTTAARPPARPPQRPGPRGRGAAADTADQGPLSTRPVLFDRLVVRLGAALAPGSRYLVEIRGVQNPGLVSGAAIQGFQIPARPAPPPPDSAAADSTRAPADTTAAAPRDTTARPRADTAGRARPARGRP